MAGVRFEGVWKLFGATPAVANLNLAVVDGEFLVFVGPSGCGKTTSLRMLAGLERPTYGRIWIGDTVVNTVPPGKRDIAMVFQSYALYPHMNVYDNLAFGPRVRHESRTDMRHRIEEVADTLGIRELLKRKPSELSGGQRQRVALGRALIRRPQLFLMDEPLSNLDAALRVQMRAELIRLHQQYGITTVYVTHDQVEAMTMGDRIAVMSNGILQQADSPEALYEAPANLFVATFIGSPKMNVVPGVWVNEDGVRSVRLLGVTVPLPQQSQVHDNAGTGRDVLVGLRPADLGPATDMSSDACARFRVQVDIVEPMGSETYVTAKSGDTTLMARFPSRSHVHPGDTVDLALDPAHMYVFDAETGLALLDRLPSSGTARPPELATANVRAATAPQPAALPAEHQLKEGTRS